MKNLIITIVSIIFLSAQISAQNSLHRIKQSPNYLYVQLHANVSYEDGEVGLSNNSQSNQVKLTYKYVNLARLQRGLNKGIQFDGVKASLAVVYLPPVTNEVFNPELGSTFMVSESKTNLAIKELSVSFATKYDRTKIKAGLIGLPYGRSPKIDGSFGLIPSLAGSDMKFSKDLGVSASFPVTGDLDASVALTMGGILSGPLMNFQFIDDGLVNYGLYSPNNYRYNSNWMITATVKNPSFMKKEYGISTVMGKINSSLNGIGSDANIFRIAPFIVIKNTERFVTTHQLSLGFTNYSFAKTKSAVLINQVESMITGTTSLYISNRLRFLDDRGVSKVDNRINAGIGFHPLPDLTLRFNGVLKSQLKGLSGSDHDPSFFIQFIYGFGRK